jgi:hypothetical protein
MEVAYVGLALLDRSGGGGDQRGDLLAVAAARSKGTYLASHYWQIRGRRGTPKAIGATRHDILVAYYHIVRDRLPYRELGLDWLARRYSPEHRARRLVRQLEALGFNVSMEAAA